MTDGQHKLMRLLSRVASSVYQLLGLGGKLPPSRRVERIEKQIDTEYIILDHSSEANPVRKHGRDAIKNHSLLYCFIGLVRCD